MYIYILKNLLLLLFTNEHIIKVKTRFSLDKWNFKILSTDFYSSQTIAPKHHHTPLNTHLEEDNLKCLRPKAKGRA